MADHKRSAPHARSFLIGPVFAAVVGIVIASVVNMW